MRFRLSIVALFCFVSTARAQNWEYGRRPPWIAPKPVSGSLSVSGFGSIIVGQSGAPEFMKSGGGVGIDLGIYFGRFLGVRLGYDASFHNPETGCASGAFNCQVVFAGVSYLVLETVHADLTLHIPTGTRFQPLFVGGVLVGILGRVNSPTDSVGGGFEAGLGFDVWLSRWATVGVEAKYRGIKLGDYSGASNSDSFLSLINVGLNFAARF